MLSGELPTYENFAKYVYYLASGKDHPDTRQIDAKSYFVGKTDRESIYLVYEKDQEKLKSLAITLKWAQDTDKKDKGRKVVYAPACYLDEDTLEKYQIQFVSIPYNLFERKEL
jgi:adenine-specific DNA-methyltransferase